MAFLTYVEDVDEFRGLQKGDRCRITHREDGTNLVFVEMISGNCKGQEIGLRNDQISDYEEDE
nr:MAG TPA: Protein of unknown function (DUF1344) [Caudoviricetes sp.]